MNLLRTNGRNVRPVRRGGAGMLNDDALKAYIQQNVNHFQDHADVIPAVAKAMPEYKAKLAELTKMYGTPDYTAEFDLVIEKHYFTVVTATGVYTQLADNTGLSAALQNTKLPAFIFGQSDFEGAFARLRQQVQLNSNWTMGIPFIYGKQTTPITPEIDATVTGNLEIGDLVVPYTSALPGGGTTTLALVVVRCNQTAYGKLLAATSSDLFNISRVRNSLVSGQESQFDENINLFSESLYGKVGSDFISPISFKDPQQNQNNIIDIPLVYSVNKASSLYVNMLAATSRITWSIFVSAFEKFGQ